MNAELIETAFLYILSAAMIAFLSGGVTAFWKNREEQSKRVKKLDKIANDVESIKHDFVCVKNCSRLTSKSYLMYYTKEYANKGGIPLQEKAVLKELSAQLHEMGENGEVSTCERELDEIPINEKIKV